jgi:hypothetical protein
MHILTPFLSVSLVNHLSRGHGFSLGVVVLMNQLVVHLDTIERNCGRMLARAEKLGCRLRSVATPSSCVLLFPCGLFAHALTLEHIGCGTHEHAHACCLTPGLTLRLRKRCKQPCSKLASGPLAPTQSPHSLATTALPHAATRMPPRWSRKSIALNRVSLCSSCGAISNLTRSQTAGGRKSGIVCSTLAEVQFFADAGFDDILHVVSFVPNYICTLARGSCFHLASQVQDLLTGASPLCLYQRLPESVPTFA